MKKIKTVLKQFYSRYEYKILFILLFIPIFLIYFFVAKLVNYI